MISVLRRLPEVFYLIPYSYYSQIKQAISAKRRRGLGLNRGTRIVAPQVSLLAIPDAPPGFCAHWVRPAPVPGQRDGGWNPPTLPYREAMKGKQSGSEALPDDRLSNGPVLFENSMRRMPPRTLVRQMACSFIAKSRKKGVDKIR